MRGQASQALGLLAAYVPEDSALRGHVYALQGYAEMFLAEAFCSGVPLSTLDYDGDFTYRPGSSTPQVFEHAVALFDTALTLAGDSARFAQLARVGRARALLSLGMYSEAATGVAAVPTNYRYEVTYSATRYGSTRIPEWNFARNTDDDNSQPIWGRGVTVSDREGGNGLDWRTSGDPRTTVTNQGVPPRPGISFTIYHPDKYAIDGSSPIVLASGVEARLIEAEAALQAGDVSTWLAKLNLPRQTAWQTIVPAVSGPLPDLADPGTPAARVDLTFRERAFWLFLTGHRQGDLRRLLRRYGSDSRFYPAGLDQGAVYPVGPYPGGGVYGSDVTLPIPSTELPNPLFTGCASRGA